MLSDAVKSQVDILDYARRLGLTPYRISSRYYTIKEMDSIRINVEKGLWYRNSLVGIRNDVNARGQIGGSVIDFAAYFDPRCWRPDGVRSKTVGGAALLYLANEYGITDNGHYRVFNTDNRYQQAKPKPRPDTNPSFTKNNEVSEAKTGIYDVPKDLSGEDKVRDYLVRVRGVSDNIVQRFIDEDMLYQSKPNKSGFSNCVFVAPNNSFVCEHGASERGRFVRTLSGSDMNELFFYSPDKSDDSSKEKTLVVTESVIDMMSVMTQFEREGRNLDDYKFLALAGVTNLGTLNDPKSLSYHLNKPENANIHKVMLALDNDDAGRRGIENAKDILLNEFNYDTQNVITYLPPEGKDWNDYIKLDKPVQPVQEPSPPAVIPDIDTVLLIEGDYLSIMNLEKELDNREDLLGEFSAYIHPYSNNELTMMLCEIYNAESNVNVLSAIAEKYDVTVTYITRAELREIYEEENRREMEENAIREISDNPMGIEQEDVVATVEQPEQEQSHRETVTTPTPQENSPVEMQENTEPLPAQEQETEEIVQESAESKPYKGFIHIIATDFQGDSQEISFLLNEGVTSEEVLNLIDYNTGYYEEVRRALRVIGTECIFRDEEYDRPSPSQLEYDALVSEGRITYEIEIDDLDSGDYSLTRYNDEKGGVAYGELELHKNYEISNGTLTYERALTTAYDLAVGDIVEFRSHECTVTDVSMDYIQFTDNVSGKVSTVRSNARGHRDVPWDTLLDSGKKEYRYSVIARAGDHYSQRVMERLSEQEESHRETVTEPAQQENAQSEQAQSVTEQESAEPSPAQENEDVTEVPYSEINLNDIDTTRPYIICEFSESTLFENNTAYTVSDFDRLMITANATKIHNKEEMLKEYGSWDNAYEAYKHGEFHGDLAPYDKTKFTIVYPDGRTYTARQDIGDAQGGVLDFLKGINYDVSELTNDIIRGQEIAHPDFVIEGGVLRKYNGNAEHVVIPEGVTGIEPDAFFGNEQITSVILPDGVETIDSGAFEGCKNLVSITIPDSVWYIGVMAFADCKSLTSIAIPDSVDSISISTFNNCTSLENVTLPNSVREIGMSAFFNCISLVDVSIPESVKVIGNSAFLGCDSLANVTIPESVTTIESAAFAECPSLTSIVIPESVVEIGEGAFDNCTSLESVSLPNIDNIALPESVNIIEHAFAGTPYFRSQQEQEKQEQSHGETVMENVPVEVQEQAVTEKENAQSVQEQTVTEQEEVITSEQPEQEVDADIVTTNTAIYSNEELSAMSASADLSTENIDFRDKSISAKKRLETALTNGLKQVLNTDDFKNWLSTRSVNTQTGLSAGNSLRIYAQNPSAQYTASYDHWNYFGRQVKNGAQSLIILRPLIPNEAQMVHKAKEIYSDLQNQVRRGVSNPVVPLYPNSPVTFTMNKQGTMDVSINNKSVKMISDYHNLELFVKKRLGEHPETFTIGHHFDVRDTIIPETLWLRKDSEDYKDNEIVKDKNGNPNIRKVKGIEKIEIRNTPERQARFKPSLGSVVLQHDNTKMKLLYDVCLAMSKNHGVPVFEHTKATDKTLYGASGYFCRKISDEYPKGYIVINADLELSEKCSVLLHEISHSELHGNPKSLEIDLEMSKLDTAMMEVQAEAVAYSVAHQFGLETDTASFKYLAAFTSGFDMRQLTASMDIIVKETEKLTHELRDILDERGYNLDLSKKNIEINVQELSTKAMNTVSIANDKCSSAMQELPKMMQEYAKDTSVVSILREQYSAYASQLAMISNVYDLVDILNNTESEQEKECIAAELQEKLTAIDISKETCNALDNKFVEQADMIKGQLRVAYENDSLSTLKEMAKSYPSLSLLSDMQLKYIAESKYISSNFGKFLKTNPSLFVEKAVERANQIPLVAAQKGAFVEITKCEQFTSRPFFENGTLCSPSVANTVFAAAERKSSEFITQAKKNNESFPTTRCDFCVYVPVGDDLKAYITHIDIGSGEQHNLYDNINQFCEQPYKENMLSACQERPLSRSIFIPNNERINGDAGQERTSDKKENMTIDEAVKTYTARSETAKAEAAQQRANQNGKTNPNQGNREKG